MLDGLLGRGFAPKCKSLIKLIKTRIDVIRRKRKATQKFLKKDIADLLANGLDINAYGRAEGLIVESNLSSCYDLIELSCDSVLKHLSVMQKQSECPEECKEAVSSLMFAAARFSDLPELRDLRHIFQERYENYLEYFVNQEFVEKLASKPSAMEKKVQLMQDIALEFSIKWDSRAFEQRMSKPSASPQDQPKTYGAYNFTDDKYKLLHIRDTVPKGDKVTSKERLEVFNEGHRSHSGREGDMLKRNGFNLQSRQELSGNGIHMPPNSKKETILKMDNHDTSLRGKREVAADKHEPWNRKDETALKTVELGGKREVAADKHEPWNRKDETALKTVELGSSSHRKRVESNDGGSKLNNSTENTPTNMDRGKSLPHGKPDVAPSFGGLQLKSNGKDTFDGNNCGGQHDFVNSMRKFQEEERNRLKPYYNNAIPPPYIKPNDVIPPPYVKSNVKPKDRKYGLNLGSSQAGYENNVVPEDPSMHKGASAGNRLEKIQVGSDHSDHEKQVIGHERQLIGPVRVNSHAHEKDYCYQDDATVNPIPKPRSVRRRHSKSRSGYDEVGNLEDTGSVSRKPRSRRRDDSRRGLQILFDDEHHQNEEEERIIDKLLIHYSKKPSTYEPGKLRRKSKTRHAHHRSTDGSESPHNKSRVEAGEKSEMVPPPVRSVSLPPEQTGPSEAPKTFTRNFSFQPDKSNAARHVHPKLPDYEDLAARFAAMKDR